MGIHTKIQAFVDGGHLREIAKVWQMPLINPLSLAKYFASSNDVTRVTYYDAAPVVEEGEDGANETSDMTSYLAAVERLMNTHLGFGSLRGRPGARRQKAVDTLLSVHMLVGAYNQNFDIAYLVAGDEDFIPAVEEVQRRGINVWLITSGNNKVGVSGELKSAVDHVIEIDGNHGLGKLLYPMFEPQHKKTYCWVHRNGKITRMETPDGWK